MPNPPEQDGITLPEGEISTIADPEPGSVRAAILRAHGRRDVLDVHEPTPWEIAQRLHRISSNYPGGLPRAIREIRSVKKKS